MVIIRGTTLVSMAIIERESLLWPSVNISRKKAVIELYFAVCLN